MTIFRAILNSIILSILLASTTVLAASVSHNNLYPLTLGSSDIMLKYLPKLDISNGCYPHTAVDINGNYNGGLKDSGSANGGCTSTDKQQVYSRARVIDDNTIAIMYAYYFPKDNGWPFPSIGHRHDWEHVVVFIRDRYTDEERIVGAAYSAHGDVSVTSNPKRSGNSIYVHYGYNGSFTHSFQEGSNGTNTDHVLVSWGNLPYHPRKTLNEQSFGSAVVPFKNSSSRFINQIEEARAALNL